MIDMRLGDCMELLRSLPDKSYDLACVDPPYGIGAGDAIMGREKKSGSSRTFPKSWDDATPSEEYFSELFRVSNNQIVWGGNYFRLPPCRGFIFWDKLNPVPNYSDGEFAWTSFNVPARRLVYGYTNVINYEPRIHPTQKPVALYKWLLTRYAKPGQTILDTHGGSGSIAIACHDLGFDLTWIEKDEDYYKAACERYKRHASQAFLFEPGPVRLPEQGSLL